MFSRDPKGDLFHVKRKFIKTKKRTLRKRNDLQIFVFFFRGITKGWLSLQEEEEEQEEQREEQQEEQREEQQE